MTSNRSGSLSSAIAGSEQMSATAPDKVLHIEPVPEEQLLLDAENPRLEGIAKIRAMWREMTVSEVALSIAASGNFEEEPLFAIPGPEVNGKKGFIVVEGNRRLTAVKLLLHEDLRKRSRLRICLRSRKRGEKSSRHSRFPFTANGKTRGSTSDTSDFGMSTGPRSETRSARICNRHQSSPPPPLRF